MRWFFTILYTVPSKVHKSSRIHTHKVVFILGTFSHAKNGRKFRTSFFIDSPLWYVKGDLYQDHDAKAAFVNFRLAT